DRTGSELIIVAEPGEDQSAQESGHYLLVLGLIIKPKCDKIIATGRREAKPDLRKGHIMIIQIEGTFEGTLVQL
ncbi:hypothetical protein, partial [Bifidobacterium rousetti]|uniref:hypothetical protein n=1 Tax=Bifidobacterium rousetti TaxID=2045439 RepID=UPI00168AEE1A